MRWLGIGIFLIGYCQNTPETIDSLYQKLAEWKGKKGYAADTMLFRLHYKLSENYRNRQPDSALVHIEQALAHAHKANDSSLVIRALAQKGWIEGLVLGQTDKAHQTLSQAESLAQKTTPDTTNREAGISLGNLFLTLGVLYRVEGDPQKALTYYLRALQTFKQIDYKDNIARTLTSLGNLHYTQGDYYRSLEYYFEALKISEEVGHKSNQAAVLSNIGNIYSIQMEMEKSITYYEKALHIYEEMRNRSEQASLLCNIGSVYLEERKYQKALECFQKALQLSTETANKRAQAASLLNIGNIYRYQARSAEAIPYFHQASSIYHELNDKQGYSLSLLTLGDAYSSLKRYNVALYYTQKAIQMAKDIGALFVLSQSYHTLSEIYQDTKNYEKALAAYKTYVLYKDSLTREENQKALIQKEMEYQFEKQQAEARAKYELQLTQAQAREERQRLWTYVITAVGLSVLVILLITYRSLIVTKRQKRIIEEAKAAIEKQKALLEVQKQTIEEQNREILDSIRYARRIQQALLPSEERWQRLLPESFLLYQPKDIIAGDFYWVEETEDYIFVAAADCTGHGVPGAMMSVLCSRALTRAVREEKITETNLILDRAREIIIQELTAEGDKALYDGMDIGLLRFSKTNPTQIAFSGANRPLWIWQNGQLLEASGDHQPVGYREVSWPFTAHTPEVSAGAVLYLASDGYADQAGGPKSKKLGTKALRALLQSIGSMSLSDQRQKLLENFEAWRGTLPQIDDVLIIGLRLP